MSIHSLHKIFQDKKISPEIINHVRLRVISILVPRRKQPLFIRSLKYKPPIANQRAINRQQHDPTRLRYPFQLLQPPELIVFVKMRENGDRVDEIKTIRRIINRRRVVADLEIRKSKFPFAPLDRFRIDIRSMQLSARREIFQMDQRAPTATPEIENAIERTQLAFNSRQRILNITRTPFPSSDKLFSIRRAEWFAACGASLSREQHA